MTENNQTQNKSISRTLFIGIRLILILALIGGVVGVGKNFLRWFNAGSRVADRRAEIRHRKNYESYKFRTEYEKQKEKRVFEDLHTESVQKYPDSYHKVHDEHYDIEQVDLFYFALNQYAGDDPHPAGGDHPAGEPIRQQSPSRSGRRALRRGLGRTHCRLLLSGLHRHGEPGSA